jgi:hypothetical protein
MLTVRPALWRPSVVIPWGLVIGACIAGSIIEIAADGLAQGVSVLLVPLAVVFIAWAARGRFIRMDVTGDVVRVREGGWRGHPDKEKSRNEVRSMHYYPNSIIFQGANDVPVMKIVPNYSMRQLQEFAGKLRVPLYDHTRWFRMRLADMGYLVYDPASGSVARPRT